MLWHLIKDCTVFQYTPLLVSCLKECFCFSPFTESETKDDDKMLEDEVDGDLHHSNDGDISNSSDDIKSRISEIYSNSACPDDMPHVVASHQALHCFSIHPFICFQSIECFCFSLFTEEKDCDMLEDEIDGDLHHSDDDEDTSNASEDQDSESSEKFHPKCGKSKQIPRNNQTRKERNIDRKVLNSIQVYSGTRSDINIEINTKWHIYIHIKSHRIYIRTLIELHKN